MKKTSLFMWSSAVLCRSSRVRCQVLTRVSDDHAYPGVPEDARLAKGLSRQMVTNA